MIHANKGTLSEAQYAVSASQDRDLKLPQLLVVAKDQRGGLLLVNEGKGWMLPQDELEYGVEIKKSPKVLLQSLTGVEADYVHDDVAWWRQDDRLHVSTLVNVHSISGSRQLELPDHATVEAATLAQPPSTALKYIQSEALEVAVDKERRVRETAQALYHFGFIDKPCSVNGNNC